jgi:sulfur-oxidizing protein SoxY
MATRRGIPRLMHVLLLAGILGSADGALAGSAWDDIRPAAFGSRTIVDGRDVLSFQAPYRAEDQRAVPLTVEAAFADGRTIKSVTLIVDENPMPVAAVFDFADRRPRTALTVNIRLDRASSVRAVIEASDGTLYMAERFVKGSGLGVCAAPPIGDPKLIAATMGKMNLTALGDGVSTAVRPRAQLEIKHPQNTYIPLRFVSSIAVHQGEEKLFDLTGSMTLSEDPRIAFDYRRNGAEHIKVRAEDTSGAVWQQDFPVGPNS